MRKPVSTIKTFDAKGALIGRRIDYDDGSALLWTKRGKHNAHSYSVDDGPRLALNPSEEEKP